MNPLTIKILTFPFYALSYSCFAGWVLAQHVADWTHDQLLRIGER